MTTQSVALQSVTSAALLVSYLEQEGVEYVFAVPGAPLNALFRELHRSSIKTVLAKHEAGAAFMAYGYARVTGRLGVCAGTAGPGTTNMITGAAAALWDGVPVLLITGQVPTRFFGMGALQESTEETMNSVNLMAQVTKHSDMVSSPHLMGRMLRKALRAAFGGRKGPVALNVPADVLGGPVTECAPSMDDYRVPQRGFDRLMLQRLSHRFKQARMPVILAGNGLVSSRADAELLQFAEEFSVPVATTQSGKGAFPERHPLSLGVFGFAGTPRALKVIREEADLLVVIGSSLGQLQTGNFGEVFTRVPLVQVDVDAQLIGRNFPVKIGLVGDAQVVLKELRFQLRRDWSEPIESTRLERRSRLEHLTAEVPFSREPEKLESDAVPLKPQRVIHELQNSLPDNAVVLWDSGSHAIWGLHYFRTANQLQWVHSGTFAAMGHSIAATVGAGLGAPGAPIVCVTGDGCFMMHGLEVSTAVNYGVPAIWIVMNNAGMRMVEQGQKALFGEAYLWEFQRVDFAKLARNLGADGHRVEKPGQLTRVIARALKRNRPTIIDCWIDPNEVPPAFTNANT